MNCDFKNDLRNLFRVDSTKQNLTTAYLLFLGAGVVFGLHRFYLADELSVKIGQRYLILFACLVFALFMSYSPVYFPLVGFIGLSVFFVLFAIQWFYDLFNLYDQVKKNNLNLGEVGSDFIHREQNWFIIAIIGALLVLIPRLF